MSIKTSLFGRPSRTPSYIEDMTQPVVEAPVIEQRSQQEIIEEIHKSFNTAVDELMHYANQKEDESSDLQKSIDKANRLRGLGFSNAATVKQVKSEETRLYVVKADNSRKDTLSRAIKYYTQNYPLYKFITPESVNAICDKYGLVFGSAEGYVGDIPDRNIQDIENFKLKEEDQTYHDMTDQWTYQSRGYQHVPALHDAEFYNQQQQVNESIKSGKAVLNESGYIDIDDVWWKRRELAKTPFEIVAPQKDFDPEMVKVGNMMVKKVVPVEDPVVLKPVMFEGYKYYLIVTCWGLEASDELVANEKMN